MSDIKTPTLFWVLIGLALVWNLLGVFAFVGQLMMTPEVIATLPQAEQDMYNTMPAWVIVAFGLAVIGGALGCVLLLLKNSLAFPVLCLSLPGVVAQMSYVFVTKSWEIYGPGRMVMPIMVIIIAVALVWYSKQVRSKPWFG
jgi:ABC-type Fe3+ transport system permease subunit